MTEQQFADRIMAGQADLAYSESYKIVNFIISKYGFEKCLNILKFMKNGESAESAVQKALNTSSGVLETDFKGSL